MTSFLNSQIQQQTGQHAVNPRLIKPVPRLLYHYQKRDSTIFSLFFLKKKLLTVFKRSRFFPRVFFGSTVVNNAKALNSAQLRQHHCANPPRRSLGAGMRLKTTPARILPGPPAPYRNLLGSHKHSCMESAVTPPLPPPGRTRLMMSVRRQSCPQNSSRQLSGRMKRNGSKVSRRVREVRLEPRRAVRCGL